MSTSLKICISDPHRTGGGQITYVCTLARELFRRGHKVYVLCREDSIFVEKSKQDGYPAINKFSFLGGVRFYSWWRDIRTMKTLLLDIQPDIVHVNGSADHWTCVLANELLQHRFCILRTRHNTYPITNHPLNKWLYLHCTDYYISVCEFVREQLISNNRFLPDRICTIHNGVDTSQFFPQPELREKARKEFGFREEHVVCGISARLTPAKGHTFLLQAIHLLKNECPELKVLILGQGALEKELKEKVRLLQLEENIVFAGFRKDIAYCTQAMDIAVLPSIDCDTSSFSLKEAMAEGKPVIASDYGGLPEIIQDGVEGKVVPAGKVEPLAQAIKELVKNPILRREMGDNARKRALEQFSLEQFVEKTERAYHRALEYHYAHSTHR